MARTKVPNPRSKQVLLRLTEDDYEILDAAAHLDRSTVNAYLYALIRDHVGALGSNEHVLRDLENRRAYKAANASVRSISQGRDRVMGTDAVAEGPS